MRSFTSARIDGSFVAGRVTLRRGVQAVTATAVAEHLTSDLSLGATVCRTEVGGNLKIKNSRTAVVRIGSSAPDLCDEASGGALDVTVGGSAWFMDNRHSVLLGTLAVAGDLGCWGNTGPRGVELGAVTAGGVRKAQCA